MTRIIARGRATLVETCPCGGPLIIDLAPPLVHAICSDCGREVCPTFCDLMANPLAVLSVVGFPGEPVREGLAPEVAPHD